jgi:hypothetical protein
MICSSFGERCVQGVAVQEVFVEGDHKAVVFHQDIPILDHLSGLGEIHGPSVVIIPRTAIKDFSRFYLFKPDRIEIGRIPLVSHWAVPGARNQADHWILRQGRAKRPEKIGERFIVLHTIP